MFDFHRSPSSTSSEESGVDKPTGSQSSATSWPGAGSILKSFAPRITDSQESTTDTNTSPEDCADTYNADKPCVTLIRSRLDYQAVEGNQTYFHAGLHERRILSNTVDGYVPQKKEDNVDCSNQFNTKSDERQRKRDKLKDLIRKVIDRVRKDKENTEPANVVRKKTISLPLAGSLRR